MPVSYSSHIFLLPSDSMISSYTAVADDSFCIAYQQLHMSIITGIEIFSFLTSSQIAQTFSSV